MPGARDLIGDRFEILELAGSGGMGHVYRVRDHVTGRDAALKRLDLVSPEGLRRFDHEARVLASIDHPSIVRYLAHGVDADGAPYLATEWVEGEDLAFRLARDPPTLEESVRLATVLARALGHVHARGIVHRDIKPGNVFLSGSRFESPRLIDFGIARSIESPRHLTRTGTTLGTPAYMPPEQARGSREIDARSDVFALGCLLFECVAGRPPWEGANVMAVLAKILFEEAPRLSELRRGVPPELDELVASMLAKQPDARPKHGEEVARQLELVRFEERTTRASMASPAIRDAELTRFEQRLLAVVMVGAEGSAPVSEDDPTVAIDRVAAVEELARAASAFGARFSPMADGSSIAVLSSEGEATDLALRAARCALAIRRERPRLPIAISLGRGEPGARVPTGEAIDKSALLLRTLGDGVAPRPAHAGILLDDLGAALLDQRFEVSGDEHGLWLTGERETDTATRRLVGKATPCVGRNRELSQLEELVIESFEEPSARGAIVTGAAGMGKSRLRFELVRRVRERASGADVWLGRAEPIAAGAAFGVLGSALRRTIGLPDGEALGVRQRKLRARIARHFVDPEARGVAEFIGELVGTPLGDDESVALRAARSDLVLMGDRITEAFCDFVSAEAAARPILLVLEDLQWGDAASVRITLAALRRARALPLFVLALGRPEAITLFPDFGPARGLTHVALGELPPKAARELVHAALAADADPALVDELVERAGGHPLYLEELVRHVAEGRSGELPTTVVAMLQARLEALPSEPRRILRAGSVFGTAFWSGAVERLMGGSGRTQELRDWMPVLLDQELIERRPSTRFPGHAEYVFRHALLRDAAYSTLTERDRAVGHALAGAWLEEQGETDPRALGEHFERAGDAGRSAIWLARAGAQALEGHDVGAAVALVRRARAHAGTLDPEERGRIALLEAEACAWSGELEEAGRAANEAIALFPRGSVEWLRAVEHAITASGRRGVYEISVDWHEQIRSAPELPGASTARVLALCAAGRQAFHAGGYELADEIAEALRVQVERREIEPRALAEIHRLLGAQARHRGDLAADLANYERALSAYQQTEDARNAENARVSLGFAYAELGEYATARAHFDQALAQAERMGLDVVATRARQNLALVLSVAGELDRAEELARQVIAESHAQGNVRFEGWTRIYLARILLARGKPEEAHAEAAHAAQMLEVTPPARAGALAVLACAAIALGRSQEAELHARGALVIVESFGGIEEFESLVWLAAVRAAELAGDEARRGARLSQALARLEERAAAIEDAELSRSFLERVPENAELRALATRNAVAPSEASIRAAFAPELFARDAAELCAALGEHLTRALAGQSPVVDEALTPDALLERFPGKFPPESRPEALAGLVSDILGSAAHQHHPHYLGYQVSAALPRAALGALLAAVLNSGMAAFDSGRGAVALERRVIDWMLGLLDWSAGDGMLTSGGSLGNLTALLAAREARASDAERDRGLAGSPGLVVLCGDQTHYSVARAAQIMGLGRRGVSVLPSDERFRLDPQAIPSTVGALLAEGRKPIALVASAGSTSTGAIDDLGRIAELCSELGLWLHVDGAHGASALLSERHRAALAGIERADSIVWDAHKLMSMPALCTAVLFRSARAASGTFAQKASYLYQAPEDAPPWYDIGLRTIECTKPLMAVPLYLSLATLGTRFFGALVDRSYALARRFAVLIREAGDFELACEPESNIVCFRHLAGPAVDLDAHQRELRARARARGFFVVTTELRGSVWLRCTLMSPSTREEDLLGLLEALR